MPTWLRNLFAWLRPRPGPAPGPVPPLPTPGPDPPADGGPTREAVVAAINYERVKLARPRLTEAARLDVVAQGWAEDMAADRMLSHGDFAGRVGAVYPNSAAAENIAAGPTTAEAVVAFWMTSPPHRANMLGVYDLVGVGFAHSRDGVLYWCADFVRPA